MKYDWILDGETDWWVRRGTEMSPTARRRKTWTARSLKFDMRDMGEGRDGDRIVWGEASS